MWKENKVELGRRAATLSPLSFLSFRRVSLLVASVNFLILLLLLFFFFLRPRGRGSGSGRGRGSGSGRGRGRSRGRGGRYRHRNGMVVLCCFSWFKDRGPSPVHSATPAPGRGPSPVPARDPLPAQPPAACVMILLMILMTGASAGEPSWTTAARSRSNARNAQNMKARGYVRAEEDVMQRG